MENDKTQSIFIPYEDYDTSSDEDPESLSCLSPPKHTRKTIKDNLKTKTNRNKTYTSPSRYVTKPKRLGYNEPYIEPDLTDSLLELQNEYNQAHHVDTKSHSEPSTAAIIPGERLIWRNSIQPELSPFERDKIKAKTESLLRIALKNKHLNIPVTPNSFTSQFLSSSPSRHMSLDPNQQKLNQDLWKELFDFFVFYNQRAETMEELDKRIEKIRSEIPQKITNILNTNYFNIKDKMNYDIDETIKNFTDYSFLYEKKIYIDLMCYLNLLVEDNLNSICYIESLYPSIRLLKQEQKYYANEKFESTSKTLLLWHKIVNGLTLKSDQLGRLFGFEKRPEYKDYWNWFDKRLSYSRNEYEKVQEWLNKSLVQTQSSSTLINSDNSTLGSPIILIKQPTLVESESKPNFFNLRQISYLLKKRDSQEETSSLSFNILSERTSPDSSVFQDPLLSAKIQHFNSFIINNSPGVFEPSSLDTDKVEFSLGDDEEPELESVSFQEEVNLKEKSPVYENRKKIFRDFLRKRLRKFGMTKTWDKIREVLLTPLSHALLCLQTDKCERNALNTINDYHLIPLHHKCRELIQQFYQDEESIKYGVHSEPFKNLGLPTFRPLFVYLNNLILDLMHLCIEMQNESKRDIKIQSNFKFSLLSIEVLTKECRECIEQAILVRQFYYHMMYSVFDHDEFEEGLHQRLETDLFKFDEDLKETINIYLNLITDWVQDLVRVSDLSKALWVLENEWNFCKNNLYFVTSSEDIYASRFCTMSSYLNTSLIHLLSVIDTNYKEPLREMIEKIEMNNDCLSAGVDIYECSLPLRDEELVEDTEMDTENLNLKFIEFKEEINKLKKSCLRTLEFSAKFIADLELAAKYQVVSPVQELLDRLHASNHVMIKFTNEELAETSSFLIFVPQEFVKDKIQLIRLLIIITEKTQEVKPEPKVEVKNPVRRLSSSNSIFDPYNHEIQRDNVLKKLSQLTSNLGPVLSGRSSPVNGQQTFVISPKSHSDGYLLFLQLTETEWVWNGNTVRLYASVPVRRSLYQHLKCDQYLYLITSRQSILNLKKIEVKQKLQGTISLVKEKASFHPSIDLSIDELKEKILELRIDCIKWIKSIERDLNISVQDNQTGHDLVKIDRNVSEVLRVSYTFGLDMQDQVFKFITQDRVVGFSKNLADFAIQWCEYTCKKTPRGKGRTVRPWAAKKGLELVQSAVAHSVHLEDWDFSKLIQAVEKCISHLIGDSEGLKPIENSRSNSRSSLKPRLKNRDLPPRKRLEKACKQTDEDREKELFEGRYIGKELEVNRQDGIINGTEVQFRWQLGLLIGEGSFGKVYSCVNLDTCEPMALKIIEFKNSDDADKVKEIADEINNVVDINHENLVKVYGSELHRKEILIFMEFCGDQCTLDRLSRDTSGLPEKLVRDYTKSLLKAVEHLHEKSIIHRDIKGANIFLKSIDNRHPEKVSLKLGDFGCSIRLKDPIGTGSRDQATGLRGTYAFMAPEVMASGGTKDAGYTYSADIWSVACVIIEMFTGKRPWHPLKDEAILYKVHLVNSGPRRPPYPSPISDEAIDFLNCCFDFDPKNRSAADQLLEHSFVKVSDEVYDN